MMEKIAKKENEANLVESPEKKVEKDVGAEDTNVEKDAGAEDAGAEDAGAEKVVLHERLRQMQGRINRNPDALEALRTIKQRGCDEAEVLTLLFQFCGGTEEEVRKGLEDAVAFKVETERLGRQLKQDAEDVKRMLADLPRFGINLFGQQHDELADRMKDFASVISPRDRGLAPSVKNVRLGNKDEGKGRVNLTAGRTHHLVGLAYLITGDEKPTFADFKLIASLLRVVRDDEHVIDIIADDLRNRFEGYVNPTAKKKRRSELSRRKK